MELIILCYKQQNKHAEVLPNAVIFMKFNYT